MKEYSFRDHLKEKLKDPYFRELYELDQQKTEIVKIILMYRIKHNLTQGKLAKQIGVSQQHISNIEAGEFSSMATLEKVLQGIGYRVKIQIIPLPAKAKNRVRKVLHHKKSIA
jgi:transcriptional regulator with XRE-family HTH domain